jgi:hypothetical protein
MDVFKRKKGGAAWERDRKKVKLVQIAEFCQNIKTFFKLKNDNKLIVDIIENEDDPDVPASCMVSNKY